MTPEAGNDHRSGSPTSVLDAPEGSSPTRRRTLLRHRGVLVAAVVLLAGLVVATVVVTRPEERVPITQAPDPTPSSPYAWTSGAAGDDMAVVDAFGDWRGSPVAISSTWADNNEAMVRLDNLQPGAEFGDWDLPLDIAIGAIGEGESWAEAADGDYDRRWRQSLQELRDLRIDRSGTTYIRFAHEMNGNWYPWSVQEDDAVAFETAWGRFRDIQQDVFPEAELVFCVNRESVDTGMDWRDFFPGAEYVDVFAVDYYNNPGIDSAEEFQADLVETDQWGGPQGLAAHLEFARSVGLPLAVPEWSGDADEGDSPAFIQGMHEFFAEHAGDGAGEVLYEVLFNIGNDEHTWVLFDPLTRMPRSAEAYQDLW